MPGWSCRMWLLVLATASVLGIAAPLSAFSPAELGDEFDARFLTTDEKRFVQAALAFVGTYNGVLDGAWGGGSQRALEGYARGENIGPPVPNWLVAGLAGVLQTVIREEGWEERYLPDLDISLLVPARNIRAGEPSDIFVNWTHAGSSLGYSFTRGDGAQVMRLHDFTLGSRAAGEPYLLRREDLWITSVRTAAGLALYVRSDLRRGGWSTVLLSAQPGDRGILAAVSGSIARGPAPALVLPPGRLFDGWKLVEAVIAKDEVPAAAAPPPVEDPEPPAGASGSGFVVSAAGDVLTNAHVVEGCRRISIDGAPVVVVAVDADTDLALLRGESLAGAPVAPFAASPALLNSDVTVAGFPLAGVLGGLNVTRGSLTSLRGLGGDIAQMQISAPIQPGNSGGPVLNAAGQVVGVVVAKLNARRMADVTGDIPQNVNFAIRGEMAKLFLAQNGVAPMIGDATEPPTPEALAQAASGFTRFISCD